MAGAALPPATLPAALAVRFRRLRRTLGDGSWQSPALAGAFAALAAPLAGGAGAFALPGGLGGRLGRTLGRLARALGGGLCRRRAAQGGQDQVAAGVEGGEHVFGVGELPPQDQAEALQHLEIDETDIGHERSRC